ncbi:MAG: ABC transporter ATP-binding protein, partial [Oscillibacter sp.]|nr:ABC transporter ATP-binding protein [Oscillibacter sp.]
VMLMDEPLSNLDAKLRNEMRAEIIKLRKRIKTTFIYVTHDQTEAMTLGDRIVIMKDGFTQQIGTPQEVFDHPANLFVAGFIGSPQMNFFEGRLVRDGAAYAVQLGDTKIALPEKTCEQLAAKNTADQNVTLGIRPNHIALSDEPDAITGTVDVYELMGSEVHLHVNVFGKDAIIIIPTTEIEGDLKELFAFGAKVRFHFIGDRCHLFNAEGKNLI